MSDAKPKWQRGLFWISIVCGGICLLLVAGFYGGKWLYGSPENVDRPGFKLWAKLYERALFMESEDKKGYRYSDLNEIVSVDARLVEIDEFSSKFIKNDGAELSFYLPAELHHGLVVGGTYRLKLQITLQNSSDWSELWDWDEYDWYVHQDLVEMVPIDIDLD